MQKKGVLSSNTILPSKEVKPKLMKISKWFRCVLAVNTVVLCIAIPMSFLERPLFFYSKSEGVIYSVETDVVSFAGKARASFSMDATIIGCEDDRHVENLVLLDSVGCSRSLIAGKKMKAWHYTKNNHKCIKQLEVNGKTVVKYDERMGVAVYLIALISLIVEYFMAKYYLKSIGWTLKKKG